VTVFHPAWRRLALSSLDQPFDLVVIGGGITGSGILLDAAQRGLRVLLVERDDIASGTSSRSSKLIHGGLRYLKQMQFSITLQACRERDRMLSLNPHLVRSLRFLYPAYHGDKTAGWKVDLGLSLYDRLTERPERHTQLDKDEVEQLAPGLTTNRLDRALSYSDAMADDARLTLAVAATGHAYGGHILTRCDVVGAKRSPRQPTISLLLHDLEMDQALHASARVVVNATGVWTDVVRERLGLPGTHLRPSRGIHLILPRQRLDISVAVSFPSPDDGRPVFLIPHPEGILLGTTDIYHEGGLDDPRPTAAEVDYLLRAAATMFPADSLTRSDVGGAFAGLRPILDTHAEDPSEASREEDIWDEKGILSVAGGKLTTWRSTAEEAVDTAIGMLPEEAVRHAAPCATKGTPLAGLAPVDLAHRLRQSFELDPRVATAMAWRLGSLAWSAVRDARRKSELRPLEDGTDLCAAEVRAHLRAGAVLRLEDLLLRRIRVGMWQPELALGLLRKLRPIVRSELGWEWSRWRREEEAFAEALEGWTLEGIRD
jgi:glycerol-3-phosphate dehydrogenase